MSDWIGIKCEDVSVGKKCHAPKLVETLRDYKADFSPLKMALLFYRTGQVRRSDI
jgi:hypothetical protein